jgi:zinc protease
MRNLARRFFLAVALPVCAVRAEAPKPNIPPIQFQHRALGNGLSVYRVEDHGNPTVAIAVWYHVGSKDDPNGRSGFAHLFEHMMFKGTKHMKPETIDRLTEDVGGSNNAYTASDVTVFHEVVPSNYLEPVLWAEAERMSSLVVDQANFKSERAVVEEEYRQRILAEPFGEFGEEIEKKSFAVHPYKRPTIGNIAELEAATLKDVQAFHSTFYRPDNATLIVVGDFEPKQLDEWVDKYFSPIEKPKAPIPRVTVKEPPRKESRKIVEYDPKVPLPALAMTYLGPPAISDDSLAVELAEEILAGGESSRLYQALVYGQQLAESVSFDADLREDLGLLAFKVILASGKPVDEAGKSVLAEIKKLQDEPLSDAELTKAKNRVLTRKLQERETAEGKAAALGEAAVVKGDAGSVNTELDKLAAVTADEVRQVMKKYFTDSNQLVLDYLPQSMKPGTKKGARK